MEPTQKHEYESDLWESQIMSECHPNEHEMHDAAIKAYRCSSRARGDDDGSVQEIYPLIREIVHSTNQEEMSKTHQPMQGILLKQSPGFFSSWQQRYIELKGQRFTYKEEASALSPTAGTLNFDLLSCEVAIEQEGGLCANFRILVINSDKEFVFRGKSQHETEEWQAAVNAAVQRSQGWHKNYSYLAHYPRFWRKDYQSESEFRKTVQAGDILLFRGLKNSSIMQRVVTRDEFDHIAVVLINQIGDPLIFEANGGLGVGLCSWSKFMSRKWWNQYDLVVHRKLQILRNGSFLERVQNFVQANMEKQYNFSLGDYLFYRNSSVQKEHQFYFCSSLVAKLYKRLELLPAERSCKQYLPSHFSEREGMELKTDGVFGYAYLESEKIIVFQQHTKQ